MAVGGFTIERLRAFCQIAESGSIVLAAKGDPTRQSQFSRQVKELEEYFGAKLIERAGRTIRLTGDGRKVALLAQAFFRSVEEMRASAAKDEALRIGAGESVFRWLILPRLAELQNSAAQVRLELLTKTTAQSVESVKAGQLDLASLPKNFGLQPLPETPDGVFVSVPERALLEMLSEVGVHQGIEEARNLMEGARSLRPEVPSTLLKNCRRVKVVPLRVTWAEELNLPWVATAKKAAPKRLGHGWRGRAVRGA